MKRSILACAVLAGFGLGAATLPSNALPLATAGVIAGSPHDSIEVRTTRPQVRRHRRSGGNANKPSRTPGAKQYGQTSGGPGR